MYTALPFLCLKKKDLLRQRSFDSGLEIGEGQIADEQLTIYSKAGRRIDARLHSIQLVLLNLVAMGVRFIAA